MQESEVNFKNKSNNLKHEKILDLFPQGAIKIFFSQIGWLKTQKCTISQFKSQMSETKLPALCGEECVPCLSPNFWWLVYNPWYLLAYGYIILISASVVTWSSSLCLPLCVSSHGLLILTPVIRFRAHSNPMTSS